jgi:hypothetical protein
MRSRLNLGVVLAATLVVGLAAGCGSSSSKSTTSTPATTATTSTPPLSKAEFLKQGNAICQRGNQQINAAVAQAFPKNKQPTPAATRRFGESVVVPNIESQISHIRALPAPAGDEAKVKTLLDAAQSALEKVKADSALLVGKTDPFKAANKLATAYGLTVCGASGG